MAEAIQIGLVILGTLLGFWSAAAMESRKSAQRTQEFWRSERRLSYARLLGFASRLENDTVRIGRVVAEGETIAVSEDDLRHPDRLADPALRSLVEERNALAELMTDAYEDLKLIGGAAAVGAARSIIQSLNDLVRAARGGEFGTAGWNSIRERLSVARTELRESARAELVVEGSR